MIDNSIFLTLLIFVPVVIGFVGCIFPKSFYWIGFITLFAYAIMSLIGYLTGFEYSYQLAIKEGIPFSFDNYSLPLIFGSAIVILITFLIKNKIFSHYFYQICFILFSALSISFLSKDLISLYIALELTGFCAFLLVADRNDPKSLFNSFQYLIGGGLAMLIYLIGVIQAFTYNGSFLLDDLIDAPPIALCLISAGLLTKAGIFLCGVWVPNVYSHANSQSSAILSGCVTCAAVAPLSRMSTILDPIGNSLIIIGILSSIFGAIFALLESNDGRTLGWSSVSQLGIAILSPSYGCLYAMQHGICKTILFLTLERNEKETTIYSNNSDELLLNNKDFEEIIKIAAFLIASLSISGLPFLSGFITKVLIKNDLPKAALLIFDSGALLTSVVYVKLISSRIKNLNIKNIFKQIFNNFRFNFLNILTSTNLTLISVCIALFGFSFLQSKYFSFDKVQMSFITIVLGFVFFVSFAGLESNRDVTKFTKTIDIIGAPFVIAALLLANLTYLKIL
tara:strand:- start:7597 stop:9120 length:1524 start_codon:yes stop_codon:yes gene_type:complete